MKRSNLNGDEYTVREKLWVLNFYLTRFEEQGNIYDFERAISCAKEVRPHLPTHYQDLCVYGLCTFYKASPSLHVDGNGSLGNDKSIDDGRLIKGRLPKVDSPGLRIQTRWKGRKISISTEAVPDRYTGVPKQLGSLLGNYLAKINDLCFMHKSSKAVESFHVKREVY